MAANLKLTLLGTELHGLTLRFENLGAKPVSVIRGYRPGFYATHELTITDAERRRVEENVDVMCCGTPYPLTADALVLIPSGGAAELAVDTRAYELPPGRYSLQLRYATSRYWLSNVDPKPAGFEQLVEGVWTSNVLDLLAR